jgi:hypothetical protein
VILIVIGVALAVRALRERIAHLAIVAVRAAHWRVSIALVRKKKARPARTLRARLIHDAPPGVLPAVRRARFKMRYAPMLNIALA